MREIKFRGITNTGVMVDGSLVVTENIQHRIYFEIGQGIIKELDWVYVKSETVGQYTGLKDINGVEIYEGDIVVKKSDNTTYRLVRYDEKRCCFEFVTKKEKNKTTNRGEIDSINVNSCCWHEVIGNIYENPELLEVK